MAPSDSTSNTNSTDQQRKWRKRFAIAAASIATYALLGFVAAPWLVRNAAIDAVGENLDATLAIEHVAINPFVLSLRIDGLALDGPDSEPVARVGQIFVNFQLSSLFRWAWSFAEVRIDRPELFIERDASNAINLAQLVPPSPAPADPEPGEAGGMPRLFIQAFAINDAAVDWQDAVPPEPVDTVFGPVSLQISELNTLPERAGQQDLVITTETQGTLSLQGSLQLDPFAASGRAFVDGSHFPLLSAYIRHATGLDVVDGVADVELAYSVDVPADGTLTASISDLELVLSDVRVNTFHAQPDDDRSPRELLSIPEFRLSGGALQWPEQVASADSLAIRDTELALVRLPGGELDFARNQPAATVPAEPPADDGSPWQLSLDRLLVDNFALGLVDRNVQPTAEVGVANVRLEVDAISNQAGAVFPTRLSMTGLHGGTIGLDGNVTVLPAPVVEFDLDINDVSLAAAHPYIQPLADVELASGTLDVSGTMRHDPDQALALAVDVDVLDFLITETDEGTRLGSWNALHAAGVTLSAADASLGISEIRFDQPYADILIAADGSVNLGRVSKAAPADAGDEPARVADKQGRKGPQWQAMIGRITIDNAAANFADESLPLPFAARIEKLDGNLSTIATGSTEPSEVALEGAVDEFGLVRITGIVTPLDPTLNTDLDVVFENVEMPKFSAYTIRFAGREIADGRLDLNLGYAVADSQLVGENRIVLRDFELGDEVPHPDATSLPLGLAVALLRDPSGRIDIDLPVRGDLNDPDFGYGRVIGRALANLVIKIVASPFALLGNLIGIEADELEYINFPAGRSDLTPPEMERIGKLVEALALRPSLVLEISGVIDREADTQALQEARVDERIEAAINASKDGDIDNYTARRLAALESLFAGTIDPAPESLTALRAGFVTIQTSEETGETSERFDELAYAAELRRRLITAELIEEQALVTLARTRADNVRIAVLAADPTLASRLSVVELREESGDREPERVRMKVALAVGND